MDKIYMVTADTDWEASYHLVAFSTRSDAEYFVQVLDEYHATDPSQDEDETDDDHYERRESWGKAHPGGYDCRNAHGFSITDFPYALGAIEHISETK